MGKKNIKGHRRMTGAYLFGLNAEGKREPMEVEHLTDNERHDTFIGREPEELVQWINTLSRAIVSLEYFLASEGYVKDDELKDIEVSKQKEDAIDRESRHSISGHMNDPSKMQEKAFKEENKKD